MKIKIVGLFLGSLFITLSCNDTKTESNQIEVKENKEVIATGDNSQNAVDWEGTYKGILPCADCKGIETTLTLMDNESYTISRHYLKNGSSAVAESGVFSWDTSGGIITLNKDNQKFRVGENQLFYLDMEGNRITGDLENHYILKKVEKAN